MGPVFGSATILHVPMWVWERLWSAAVMLIAYEGARRLASRWPGIGPWGGVVAGLSYMLAPRVLLTVGGLSGETLPAAVLPWTVLPLLLYFRGRLRARVAFLWSAATVPLMGGQNATLVVACLLLPGCCSSSSRAVPGGAGCGDAVAWGGLVVAASLWWLVPLRRDGRLRPAVPRLHRVRPQHGQQHRLADLAARHQPLGRVLPRRRHAPGGRAGTPWSPRSVLLATTVAGGRGRASSGLALRRPLGTPGAPRVALVGLAILTLGHGGWSGSVLSPWWLEQLDGPLAPLRNVHKFDPLVRLPLSLGVGAFVSVGLPALVVRIEGLGSARARLAAPAPRLLWSRPRWRPRSRPCPATCASTTAWRTSRRPGARRPLTSKSRTGRSSALVLPGSGFAVQDWGRTIDEPIQVLGAPPWLARAQVTVAPAGTLRLLDSIEDAVRRGAPAHRPRRTTCAGSASRTWWSATTSPRTRRTRRLRTWSTHRSPAPTDLVSVREFRTGGRRAPAGEVFALGRRRGPPRSGPGLGRPPSSRAGRR